MIVNYYYEITFFTFENLTIEVAFHKEVIVRHILTANTISKRSGKLIK